MVIEKELGPEATRRFLRRDLDRYLDGRSREELAEMPLLRVEDQPYIHYHKGSLVMYALKDYVGEEAVNRALRRYLEAEAFKDAPYTNSLDLLGYIREEVPPDLGSLLEDLFETVTLFDTRMAAATYAEQDGGTFRVKLRASARKLRVDEKGVETEVPVDDWIEIGVFGEEEVGGEIVEKVLYLEKRRITGPATEFELVVPERPVRAGIDPYTRLIDRDVNDNVMELTQIPAEE